MKVLLVNGSAHEKGSTNRALTEMCEEFKKQGIEASVFWIGKNPIPDSLTNSEGSPSGERKVAEFKELAKEAQGFVFGSPVYFANVNGQLLSFMNRVFYGSPKGLFEGKVAAGMTVARRAGVITAVDEINHYFFLKQMIMPTAFYWNQVYGATAADVEKDTEGLQNCRRLAQMMAYVLKLIECGKNNGIDFPEFSEKKAKTNFIRLDKAQ